MKSRHLLALMLALAAQTSSAQTFPTKPVRLMVGANAGGGTDIIARMLAEKMADGLKGTYVVENKPGASNTIAADLTAKAPPDGHTLLVATNTGQAIAPHLIKLSFDPIKDFIEKWIAPDAPEMPRELARRLVEVIDMVRALDLKKPPSIAESIDWARTLLLMGAEDIDRETFEQSMSILVKHRTDIDLVASQLRIAAGESLADLGQTVIPATHRSALPAEPTSAPTAPLKTT